MSKDKITLHLVLKKKWWDMIDSGVKTEEYREIKPYWCARIAPHNCPHAFPSTAITEWHCNIPPISVCPAMRQVYANDYSHVCFHKGYTSNTITFEIESISVGKGKPEWGAPQEDVFIIKLGKRL